MLKVIHIKRKQEKRKWKEGSTCPAVFRIIGLMRSRMLTMCCFKSHAQP